MDKKRLDWCHSELVNWEYTKRNIKSYSPEDLADLITFEVYYHPPRKYVFQRLFIRYWKLKGRQVNAVLMNEIKRRVG